MEENTNTTPQTEAEAPAQEIDLENVTLEELEARVNQELAANAPEEETATVEEVLGIQTPQEERDDGEPEDTAPEEVPAEPPAIQAYENIEDDPRFQEVFNRVLGDRLRKERAKLAKAQRENDEMVQLLKIRDPGITAERLRQQVWEELADETGLDSKAIQLLQRLVGGNQPMPAAEQEEHEAPEAPAAPTVGA